MKNFSGTTMMILVLCGLLGAGATAENASPGAGLVLIENGQPRASIVCAADAPDSVKLAARELQHYLRDVSGAELPLGPAPDPRWPVRIWVGAGPATTALGLNPDGLKSDGFIIQTGPDWLAILGRDTAGPPITGLRNPWRMEEVYNSDLKLGAFGEAGTLYGVYHFLEQACGIRWYLPGELGTVLPKSATVTAAPGRQTREPDFTYRYPWFCNFQTAPENALWFRRAGFGAPWPAQIIDSFAFFLKYKDAHPDWFALIGGERDFTTRSCIQGGGNLCLSNPEVARQWIDDINAYFDANPAQHIYPLSPNDGMQKICECPACQAQLSPALGNEGRFSDYVWMFVNTVAAGVGAKHPDKLVGCIAYESYHTPPSKIEKLHPNVAVMICKERGRYTDPEYHQKIHQAIAAWQKKTNNIYVWEYYLQTWPPWNGFPVFYPRLIAEDLAALKGVGQGEFIESESWVHEPGKPAQLTYPGMQHLNLYLTARLLWDAHADVNTLLEEYYRLFYGPAAAPMKAFWGAAEAAWMAGRSDSPVNVYPPEMLGRLEAALTEARQLASDGSLYRQRVELVAGEFEPARRRLGNTLVTQTPELALAGPASAMKIDGRLDEAAWQGQWPAIMVERDGEPAAQRTLVYGLWDERNLYFAFINYEPAMDKLRALATAPEAGAPPAIWDDDCIEMFLAPDPAAPEKCFQFIVNAAGMKFDGRYNGAPPPDVSWNSSIEAAVTREPHRWILEARIPLADLGLTQPPAGLRLAGNFYRCRVAGDAPRYSCWSPTLGLAHYAPQRFGALRLAKP